MARVGDSYYRRDDPSQTSFTIVKIEDFTYYLDSTVTPGALQGVHKYELESEWHSAAADDLSQSRALALMLHNAMTAGLKTRHDGKELNQIFQANLKEISNLFDWMTPEWWVVEKDPFFTVATPQGVTVRRIVPAILSGMQIDFDTTGGSSTAVVAGTDLFCVGPTPLMALVGLARVIEAKGAQRAAEG